MQTIYVFLPKALFSCSTVKNEILIENSATPQLQMKQVLQKYTLQMPL